MNYISIGTGKIFLLSIGIGIFLYWWNPTFDCKGSFQIHIAVQQVEHSWEKNLANAHKS